jgi:menaquinone-dependent protoporphyrinogen oxidase
MNEMKTIIIYDTKHGTTKKVSEKLTKEIGKETKIVRVRDIKDYNLRIFDAIIIGGSIHAGQIQGSIKRFCKENEAILKEKKLGLFLIGMLDEEKQKEQIKNAYPQNLREHSTAQAYLGGEFLFEKMNFIEKLMIKIIAKTNKTTLNIKNDAIKEFAKEMKK